MSTAIVISPYTRRNISFFLVPPAPSAQDGIQDAMESLFPCAGQTFGTDPNLRYFGDPVSGMYMEHYYGSEPSPQEEVPPDVLAERFTPHKFDPSLFRSSFFPQVDPMHHMLDPGPPPADWETCLAQEIVVIPDVESDGWIVTLMGTSMNRSVIYAKIEMIGLGAASELTQVQGGAVQEHLAHRQMAEAVARRQAQKPLARLTAPVAKIAQDPRMGTLLPIAVAAFAGYLLARRGAARNNLI